MPASAPRIDHRLLSAIADLDRRGRPIAETNRLVGELATALELPRPSYEQVRATVHAARNARRFYGWRNALEDLSFRTRAPQAIAHALIERPEIRKRT